MTYRIIGYTDSINECDCCGKTELKGTYVMADEMDNELYFGRVCGAKAAQVSVKDLDSITKSIKIAADLDAAVYAALNNAYGQEKIIKSLPKLGININDFIKKYGEVIEKINDFSIYKYGNKCYNIID